MSIDAAPGLGRLGVETTMLGGSRRENFADLGVGVAALSADLLGQSFVDPVAQAFPELVERRSADALDHAETCTKLAAKSSQTQRVSFPRLGRALESQGRETLGDNGDGRARSISIDRRRHNSPCTTVIRAADSERAGLARGRGGETTPEPVNRSRPLRCVRPAGRPLTGPRNPSTDPLTGPDGP